MINLDDRNTRDLTFALCVLAHRLGGVEISREEILAFPPTGQLHVKRTGDGGMKIEWEVFTTPSNDDAG